MSSRRVMWMGIWVLVSWLWEVVHNAIELPQLTVISPENSIPAIMSLALFIGWWKLPARRIMAMFLLGWALLHLIGGAIISVIPFGFLPFYPEQSVAHYASHVVYGLAQIPLIVLTVQELRSERKAFADETSAV